MCIRDRDKYVVKKLLKDSDVGAIISVFKSIKAVSYTHLDVYKRQVQRQVDVITHRRLTPPLAAAPRPAGTSLPCVSDDPRAGLGSVDCGALTVGAAARVRPAVCLRDVQARLDPTAEDLQAGEYRPPLRHVRAAVRPLARGEGLALSLIHI